MVDSHSGSYRSKWYTFGLFLWFADGAPCCQRRAWQNKYYFYGLDAIYDNNLRELLLFAGWNLLKKEVLRNYPCLYQSRTKIFTVRASHHPHPLLYEIILSLILLILLLNANRTATCHWYYLSHSNILNQETLSEPRHILLPGYLFHRLHNIRFLFYFRVIWGC